MQNLNVLELGDHIMDIEQALISAAYLQDQQDWERKKEELEQELLNQSEKVRISKGMAEDDSWPAKVLQKLLNRKTSWEKKHDLASNKMNFLEEEYNKHLLTRPDQLPYELAILYGNKIFTPR